MQDPHSERLVLQGSIVLYAQIKSRSRSRSTYGSCKRLQKRKRKQATVMEPGHEYSDYNTYNALCNRPYLMRHLSCLILSTMWMYRNRQLTPHKAEFQKRVCNHFQNPRRIGLHSVMQSIPKTNKANTGARQITTGF